MTLNPGEGAIIRNQNAAALTLSFVGEVLRGNWNIHIPLGFSIRSSIVPLARDFSGLHFPTFPVSFTIYRMTGADQTYTAYSWNGFSWDSGNGMPVALVSEAFWINTPSHDPNWNFGWFSIW